jgi:peptidyl-prolyl cis-trans isomerase D
MFDLFRSRAKATRYLMGGLLMMVAIMMVVTLIPGINAPSRTDSQVLAEIGGEALTAPEVQRTVQAQLQNKAFPPQMASVFIPQIVDQMIAEYAMAFEAERLGFDVTDTDVANAIRAMMPQLFDGENFAGREAYAAVLAQQNATIPQFERILRRQLLIEKLQSLSMEGIVVSDREVEAEFHRSADSVKLEYVVVDPAKMLAEVVIKPEEVQAYFNANRNSYQIPEKRSAQILIVDEAAVAQSITIPEAELRRAYDQNKDTYRLPERVHVRHILLKTTNKSKEETAKIKIRAEDLLKQIRQGADFAELAKKNSEDPGSAAKGGDLDFVVRGQTVKAFEEAAFSLKPKETSNVITTEYGFHIVQVLEKQEARVQPFEEVKTQLAEEHKKQQVFETMQNLSDQARAALVKDPKAAEKIAGDLKLQLVRADKLGSDEPLPGIGTSRELQDAISPLRKNEVTPVVQIAPTRLAVAVVTEVFPARPAELAEVTGKIKSVLGTQMMGRLTDQRAKEVQAKAAAMNGDLKKTAQSMGLDWKATPAFSMDGAAEGLGPAENVHEAFTHPAGYIFGPVAVNDRKFICKVTEKLVADPALLPARRQELSDQIKTAKSRERMELFQKNLRDRLVKEGKIKIYEDAIKRMAASFANSPA